MSSLLPRCSSHRPPMVPALLPISSWTHCRSNLSVAFDQGSLATNPPTPQHRSWPPESLLLSKYLVSALCRYAWVGVGWDSLYECCSVIARADRVFVMFHFHLSVAVATASKFELRNGKSFYLASGQNCRTWEFRLLCRDCSRARCYTSWLRVLWRPILFGKCAES